MTQAICRQVVCRRCSTACTPIDSAPMCPACQAPVACIVDSCDASMREDLETALPVLIDFWAPWCGPCMQMKPWVEELAWTFAGRIKVLLVNADTCFQSALFHRVSSYPTLIFGRDGRRLDVVVGAVPPQVLNQKAAQVLR